MKIRDRVKELRRVRAGDLLPNPKNWRTHPKEQHDAMRGVLSEIGYAGAALAYDTPFGLMLIDGHLRAETTPDAEIPVLVLDVTEEEAEKLLATFDPLSAMATTDQALLQSLLDGVSFESDAVNKMLEALLPQVKELPPSGDDPGAQSDRAAELEAKWGTERGQVWQIGRHRLAVADCTDPEAVAALMGPEKAALCFTSPPYNVAKNSALKNKKKYTGDDDARDTGEYLSLLSAFTLVALKHSMHVMVNLQSVSGNKLAIWEYLHGLGANYADTIVWDKEHADPAMCANVMNSRFEFVFIFNAKGNRVVGTRKFRGDVENVLSLNSRADKEQSDVHKATFPTALPTHFVETFTNMDELVFEPFCGTGTTMVACEQLGRSCYGVEIDPSYSAVILERMSGMGITPQLVR